MTRLEAIISFIKPYDLIVDVGCDHAYVSKTLEKRGQKSIASDIVPSIINKRKKENSNLITYYLSDGLKNIDEEFDYPVICGMGTFTILKIIKESNMNFKKCLISSNSDIEELRRGMNELGFLIDKELIVKEKGKYYNIIMFKKGKCTYTDKEYFIGINHMDKEILEEYRLYLLNKYTKLISTIPRDKQYELKRRIELLK